jgi:hypothetical protein
MREQRICANLASTCRAALEARSVAPEDRVATHYHHFVEAASLIALLTGGETRPECQVWEWENCGVRFRDEKTLVLTVAEHLAALGTQWVGNIARDGCVRLLFVIDGVTCASRMTGRARLEHRPGTSRAVDSEARVLPAIVVSLDGVYFRRLPAGERSQCVCLATTPSSGRSLSLSTR